MRLKPSAARTSTWLSWPSTKRRPSTESTKSTSENSGRSMALRHKVSLHRQLPQQIPRPSLTPMCLGAADKENAKRIKVETASTTNRTSPGATPSRKTSRSGSGPESHRGSEPPAGRQRLGSVVSTAESQCSASAAPSVANHSPQESTAASPVVPVKPEQPSSRGSPTLGTVHPQQGLPLLPAHHGEDRGMQRQLPSLSDVFDNRGLSGSGRPSSSDPSNYHYSAHGHSSSDVRCPTINSEPHYEHSSHPTLFSHPPRTAADGPLPIHALLANKPEPTYDHRQPLAMHPHQHHHHHSFHGNPFQAPANHNDAAGGLPALNGMSQAA